MCAELCAPSQAAGGAEGLPLSVHAAPAIRFGQSLNLWQLHFFTKGKMFFKDLYGQGHLGCFLHTL